MELSQVRYFLALAKTLNFTRAAEACNVTQPALTRAIQRLEEELGGPLLYRERSLTHLTDLGKAMLPHLDAAYMAAETATAQAAAFKRRDAAPLRLGLDPTISAHLLTSVLRELQDRIKGFELGLIEGSSEKLCATILDGELDAAVIAEPGNLPDRINRWPLFEDRYVVLCRSGHRFSNLGEVPVSVLAEERVLRRAQSACDFDRVLDRLCPSADIKWRPGHRGGSEDLIRHMVGAGLGVAISAASQPVASGTVAVPFDEPAPVRQVIVVAAARRLHSPSLATFLKLMRARDWKGEVECH